MSSPLPDSPTTLQATKAFNLFCFHIHGLSFFPALMLELIHREFPIKGMEFLNKITREPVRALKFFFPVIQFHLLSSGLKLSVLDRLDEFKMSMITRTKKRQLEEAKSSSSEV